MHKKTIKIDLPIHADAKFFLQELLKQKINLNRWEVKVKTPKPDEFQGQKKFLNVYRFLEELGKVAKGYHVATANGMASLTPHQALLIKRGQRFMTNAGLGQMGSGLPLAMGACIAAGKKPTICTEGDGSLMLNLQDLQTVLYHHLPIKLFIFNNNGYYSIRVTHEAYFKKVFAADPNSGVTFPNYEKLIKAWGLPYVKIASDKELFKVKKVIDAKGPIVCELMLDPKQPILPKWSASQLKETKLDK